MRWLHVVAVSGGVVATLFITGCGRDEPIAGPSLAVQAARPAAGLKVTPPQLNFTGTGESATLSASTSTGPIAVGVSTPACVSVVVKTSQPKQAKFTVTATAAGSCTITVTDAGTGNVQVPVTVAPSLVGTTLALGSFHTCGLDVNGAAWCWGSNGYGQLGNANTLEGPMANPTPEQVSGGLVFTTLAAGSEHTCGLTPAGAAYCWGRNTSGQLGNPTNSGDEFAENPSPLLVTGGLTFSVLRAAPFHTCGITTQGVTYCWGRNRNGQLGTTTNNGTLEPNPAPAPIDGGLALTDLALGSDFTCGVATGGAVYCWGVNMQGVLGHTQDLGDDLAAHPVPTQIPGVSLASLTAGSAYACGLTSAGAAWCWGDNLFGQLSGSTDALSATPVAVTGGLSFTSIGAGGGHVCGLTSAGAVYCWGANLLGQLGTLTNFGTGTPNYSPAVVPSLTLSVLAVRAAHTCGLTAAGAATCFGFNRYGQLGSVTNNDTDTGVPTPQTVLGGIVFATP